MIEVVRDKGELERDIWKFHVLNDNADNVIIQLGYYSNQSRASKRHKFKESNRWDSFDERYYRSPISRADVPEPEDVIEEAIKAISVTYKPLDKDPINHRY